MPLWSVERSFSSSGSLRALTVRKVEFTDRALHLISERPCVTTDSQFAHLIKSTVTNFGVQSSASALAETDKICVYSSF